jgi:hypothetical protein
VNEGAPATWDKMRDLLERKQYGEMNPVERAARSARNSTRSTCRYFRRQWILVGPDDYPALQESRRVTRSTPARWPWCGT